MGRGSIEKASAKGLLYGHRRRGSGPADIPNDPWPVPASLAGLEWPEYIGGLTNLLVSLGLAEKPSAQERQKIGNQNFDNLIATSIDIAQDQEISIRLVPHIDADGSANVGIYKVRNATPGNVYLQKGERALVDATEAEAILTHELRSRGVKKLGLALDGQDLIARLDDGEPITMTGGSYPLGNRNERSWALKTNIANHIIGDARDNHHINQDEEQELVEQISDLLEDGDILGALQESLAGRVVIASQSSIYVEKELNR